MRILKVSTALVALLLSSNVLCQEIQFNVNNGDAVSIDGLTLVLKVKDLPSMPDQSVQSRLYVEIRDEEGSYWAQTRNGCQVYPGTYSYWAFRMEMVNLNSMEDYWCAERNNLSVVVKSVPLVGKFQVGDELIVWAKFQWADNGWHSVADEVHLTVE